MLLRLLRLFVPRPEHAMKGIVKIAESFEAEPASIRPGLALGALVAAIVGHFHDGLANEHPAGLRIIVIFVRKS